MDMTVKISPQGEAIVKLCEKKVLLQQEAELINTEVHDLLMQIKALSDKQAGILIAMGEMDEQIERLAHGI